MNGEPLRRLVTIRDPQGLHLRPLTAFVKLALQFQSQVTVSKKDSGEPIDGKSSIGLLSLFAEQGSELVVEICGPDQQEALDALVPVLERPDWDEA